MNTPGLPKLALIAGPTASGKSALAMALARAAPSVIINADAMQVYRDLRVLTARPPPADETEIPHRLFGYIDGGEACSAARWAADAKVAIASAQDDGRLPIVVGGTGLYIRTLLDGIAPVPAIDPAVREAVRGLPVSEAHAALTSEDPNAAARLAPTDTTRVARALEVVRSTGKPLAAWQAANRGGIGDTVDLVPLVLLPPRDWLFDRIDRRFDGMLEGGAIAEVSALRARELDPALPVMRAIGVREIADLLDAKVTESQARDAGRLASRQYAKRQYTWFSRQPPAHWPRIAEQVSDSMIESLVTKLRDMPLTA